MLNILNIFGQAMYIQQLGERLRKARKDVGLTQEALAHKAGVSRVTVNQLENGLVPELGCQRLIALLSAVGMELAVVPKTGRERDYLKLACASANVGYKTAMTPEELARALLSGKAPASRRPHLRAIFDEAPEPVFEGLLAQVEPWTKPGRVRRNVEALATRLASRRAHAA